TRNVCGKVQARAGCSEILPVLTLVAFASSRTSPAGASVSIAFAGQNRNEVDPVSVLRPSPANSRSPGRAASGVSVSARSSLLPVADRTSPTGSSFVSAKATTAQSDIKATEPRASSTPGDDRKSCTGEHRLEENRTG